MQAIVDNDANRTWSHAPPLRQPEIVLHATLHACMQVNKHFGASRPNAFIGISALENSLAKVDFFHFPTNHNEHLRYFGFAN